VTNPLRSNEIVIEVHVPDLRHLFNAIDPSPFRVRDLSPEAESFIVGWAETAPRNAPLSLVVHADRWLGPDDESALRNAVQEYFGHRAEEVRRKLARLLSVGRTSLAIGIAFLAVVVVVGQMLERALGPGRLSEFLRESLLIGGWVVMWKPLEIFLYDWWPIRAEARLLERLARMPTHLALHDPHA
jgi:hypothetical protein